MTNEYDIKITDKAREQLRDISHYIANSLGSPETAINMLELLQNKISSLSIFPSRIALTDDEPLRDKNIHKMVVKNYYIYFIVDNETRTVNIIAVIYAGRNQAEQLNELSFE